MRKIDEEYRRNLPHIQPDNGVFSVTYRIKGSLPKSIIEDYENEYEKYIMNPEKAILASNLFFEIVDDYLDRSNNFNLLNEDKIAEIIINSLNYYDRKYFKLITYCIMPNHVHVIVDKRNFPKASLSSLFGSIKGYSSYRINKELERKGHFWTSEIYDHLIKGDKELEAALKYVINNPVKAGLVNVWDTWKYSYLLDGYLDL